MNVQPFQFRIVSNDKNYGVLHFFAGEHNPCQSDNIEEINNVVKIIVEASKKYSVTLDLYVVDELTQTYSPKGIRDYSLEKSLRDSGYKPENNLKEVLAQ